MEFELIDPDQKHFLSYARKRAEEMRERDPIVGDVVHYMEEGDPECLAAVVIKVHFDYDEVAVDLLIHGPISDYRERKVEYDEGRGNGYWHWPEVE